MPSKPPFTIPDLSVAPRIADPVNMLGDLLRSPGIQAVRNGPFLQAKLSRSLLETEGPGGQVVLTGKDGIWMTREMAEELYKLAATYRNFFVIMQKIPVQSVGHAHWTEMAKEAIRKCFELDEVKEDGK